MFGLQKWQLYALAAVAGYFVYKNYFGATAAAPTQSLPAPSPVQQGSAVAAYPNAFY